MGSMGPSELLIIFLIVLLLFGSKKLPELARGMGKGLREFQKASRDIQSEISRMDYKPKSAGTNTKSTVSAPVPPQPEETTETPEAGTVSGTESE